MREAEAGRSGAGRKLQTGPCTPSRGPDSAEPDVTVFEMRGVINVITTRRPFGLRISEAVVFLTNLPCR